MNRVTSLSSTVGFVYINRSPDTSFLAQLVSDNSRSLEKSELGALSSQATAKKKISVWGLSFCLWLPVRWI